MQIVKKFILLLFILALLLLLAFYYNKRMQAPDVIFTTLAGKTIHMADLKGKVVLVNFWSTDCKDCVQEMPDLVNTYNSYKSKNFAIIAVAMSWDPPAQVLNYATHKKLPFMVMHDGFGEVEKKFHGVSATPTTYVFDQSGKRLFYKVGRLNFTELNQLLNKALS